MRLRTFLGNCVGADFVIDIEPAQLPPVAFYRHRYRCWACKGEGVLEFEPDASEPSWTECHHCGIDNEFPPRLYERPSVIPGHVSSRFV